MAKVGVSPELSIRVNSRLPIADRSDSQKDGAKMHAMSLPETETKIIVPDSEHPATPYLTRLLGHNQTKGATDIILRPREEGACFYRSGGKFQKTIGWELMCDDEGRLMEQFGSFEKIAHALRDDDQVALAQGAANRTAITQVFRMKTFQVRVQISNGLDNPNAANFSARTIANKRIFIRIQPRVPPRLETLLGRMPSTLPVLRDASGLIVICGPVGAGKTTMAASLVNDLAETGKHIMTIEDPVEYWLEPKQGLVSHNEANFLGDPNSKRPSLPSLIPNALRGDIDGLFIGESRDCTAIETALQFAGAHEPVITTFHAGSISDCIMRMFTMVSKSMGEHVAKMTIAQSLHAILYVNLAYNDNGQPIPTLMCLPVQTDGVRAIISDCNPRDIKQRLDDALNNQSVVGRGAITRQMAITDARERRATPDSIAKALK